MVGRIDGPRKEYGGRSWAMRFPHRTSRHDTAFQQRCQPRPCSHRRQDSPVGSPYMRTAGNHTVLGAARILPASHPHFTTPWDGIMGVNYFLVNVSKRERIDFACLPVGRSKELAGDPASAAVTTWYLLKNSGDMIGFISDTYGEWPFSSGSRNDWTDYPDVTERIITELVREGILEERGTRWQDVDEPNLRFRHIVNIWIKDT